MTTSLLDAFLTRARQLPDGPVLDFERRRFTAGQLAAELAPLKAQLSALEWLVTVEPPPQAVPWPTLPGVATTRTEERYRSRPGDYLGS